MAKTKFRFVCCFLPPAVSVSVSDSWFGKVVLFFLIVGLFCWSLNQFGLCIKKFGPPHTIVGGVTPPTSPDLRPSYHIIIFLISQNRRYRYMLLLDAKR